MTCDRIFVLQLLNLGLCEECSIRCGLESSRTAGYKQTQSGSSSRSSRNWGAAEVAAIGEQKLKQMHNRGVAVEADAIREQQLKRMQPGSSS